jgi:DNA transformation protein
MAISKQFVEYVIEQLQGLERLTSRRMFSGVGLYSDGLFFGLLYHERLYFRTDDTTRPEYEARGSEGFRPRPNIKRMKMRYYTVPADVLEDAEELVKWARKATAVALAAENAKPAKKPPGERSPRTKGRGESGQRNDDHDKSRPTKEGQRKASPRKAAGKQGQRMVRPREVAPATLPASASAAASGTAAPDGRRPAATTAKKRAKATR